ncbi:unknown [Oscillibacter sp. CAG:155]|nr:unknown [Oscillibacter sp. CAG:155]
MGQASSFMIEAVERFMAVPKQQLNRRVGERETVDDAADLPASLVNFSQREMLHDFL